MLKTLLPTTLPTAMSRSPFSAAVTEVATSGIEVPAATMVSAITSSLTPAARAKATAASTSHFAPNTSSARPARTSSTWTDQCRSQARPGGNACAYSSRVAAVSRRDCTMRNAV